MRAISVFFFTLDEFWSCLFIHVRCVVNGLNNRNPLAVFSWSSPQCCRQRYCSMKDFTPLVLLSARRIVCFPKYHFLLTARISISDTFEATTVLNSMNHRHSVLLCHVVNSNLVSYAQASLGKEREPKVWFC